MQGKTKPHCVPNPAAELSKRTPGYLTSEILLRIHEFHSQELSNAKIKGCAHLKDNWTSILVWKT